MFTAFLPKVFFDFFALVSKVLKIRSMNLKEVTMEKTAENIFGQWAYFKGSKAFFNTYVCPKMFALFLAIFSKFYTTEILL